MVNFLYQKPTYRENTALAQILHSYSNILSPMRWWSLDEPHKALWCHRLLALWRYVFNGLLSRGLQQLSVMLCMSTYVLRYCHTSAVPRCTVPTAPVNTLRIHCMDKASCNAAPQVWTGELYIVCGEFSIQKCCWSCAKNFACCEYTSCFEHPKC